MIRDDVGMLCCDVGMLCCMGNPLWWLCFERRFLWESKKSWEVAGNEISQRFRMLDFYPTC